MSAVYPYQSGAAQPTCSSRLSFQPRALISFWQLGLPSIFQSIILSIQQGFHRHLILINLRMKKIWTFTGTCMWRKLCTLNRHVSQTNFKTCKCTGDHPEQPGRKGFWMEALPTRGVMSRFLIATVRCFRSPSTPPFPPSPHHLLLLDCVLYRIQCTLITFSSTYHLHCSMINTQYKLYFCHLYQFPWTNLAWLSCKLPL